MCIETVIKDSPKTYTNSGTQERVPVEVPVAQERSRDDTTEVAGAKSNKENEGRLPVSYIGTIPGPGTENPTTRMKEDEYAEEQVTPGEEEQPEE